MVDRRGDQTAIFAHLEPGAEIVLAHVIGGDIPSEQCGLVGVVDDGSPRQCTNQRQQKEEAARALFEASPTPENKQAWKECRSESDRVFWEHPRLMQQLKQSAEDS